MAMTDLTMSILDGPLEQTDLGLEDENSKLQPDHGLGSGIGRFECFGSSSVRLGRSSGTDLGLEDENSDNLDAKTDVLSVVFDVSDANDVSASFSDNSDVVFDVFRTGIRTILTRRTSFSTFRTIRQLLSWNCFLLQT